MTRSTHARASGPRQDVVAPSRWALVSSAIPPSLRGAALMPAAALAVHQLRYRLAFGDDAPQALAAQGHSYLSSLAPWIVLLAALALGASLGSLARRWTTAAAATPLARRTAGLRVWAGAAVVLLSIYAGQELLEGALAGGHAAGLAGVFGGGGWWALPAALLVGGLLALAMRGADVLEQALAAARVALELRGRRGVVALLRPAAPRLAVRPAPLACAAAGRAPPRRRGPHLT